jgi:hypothetical protein
MTVALVGLSLLLFAAIAGLVILALRSQLTPGPSLCSVTLVVHTRDEQSIRGILTAQHADRISLRDTVYIHGADQQPAGLVHIPTSSISWMQEIVGSSE